MINLIRTDKTLVTRINTSRMVCPTKIKLCPLYIHSNTQHMITVRIRYRKFKTVNYPYRMERCPKHWIYQSVPPNFYVHFPVPQNSQ